jgi:hypothetical protein
LQVSRIYAEGKYYVKLQKTFAQKPFKKKPGSYATRKKKKEKTWQEAKKTHWFLTAEAKAELSCTGSRTLLLRPETFLVKSP